MTIHNGRFARVGGEHGRITGNDHRQSYSPDPKSYPKTLQSIFLKVFALKSTTLGPNFGRGERWRGPLPVGGHVRHQPVLSAGRSYIVEPLITETRNQAETETTL